MKKGDIINFENEISGKITLLTKNIVRVFFEDISFIYGGKLDGSGFCSYNRKIIEKGIKENKITIK